MHKGLDVSVVQGPIQWDSVLKAGFEFVYVKGPEGNASPDSNFHTNASGAKSAGLLVGAYSFLYPLPHLDPKEQAKAHQDICGDRDLIPVIDVEWPPSSSKKRPLPFQEWQYWGCGAQQIRDWVKAYLEVRPDCMIYTYPDFWYQIGGIHDSEFANYPLWLADYPHEYIHNFPTEGQSPRQLKPWTDWTVWQFTGGGLAMPGTGVPVDGNVCRDLDMIKVSKPYTTPIAYALPDLTL
jgi:lysozyme